MTELGSGMTKATGAGTTSRGQKRASVGTRFRLWLQGLAFTCGDWEFVEHRRFFCALRKLRAGCGARKLFIGLLSHRSAFTR